MTTSVCLMLGFLAFNLAGATWAGAVLFHRNPPQWYVRWRFWHDRRKQGW